MQLKTVSSFGLAFLLVVGVVGVASVQDAAATPGVLIRVDSPDDKTWAKIGTKVEIRVLSYDEVLDGGFVLSVRDSALADGATGEDEDGNEIHLTFTVSSNASITGMEELIAPENDERDVSVAAAVVTDERVVKGHRAGIDTFRITFTVPAGEIQTDNNRAVKIVVDPTAQDLDPVNNQSKDKAVAEAPSGFGALPVGDGVKFGIDNTRPVHTDVFESIVLDTNELSVDTLENQPKSITAVRMKVGDPINLTLNLNTRAVLDSRPAKVEIGIVEADSAFSTAPISFTLGVDKLYQPVVKVSGEITEGSFADNEVVAIRAILVDAAGNLGAASASADDEDPVDINSEADGTLADGFEDNFTITADGTTPKITVNFPNPDSLAIGSHNPRITAVFSQIIDYVFENGNLPPDLSPLSFDISEEVDSILVEHADSSVGFGRFVDADDINQNGNTLEILDPTGGDSTAILDLEEFREVAAEGDDNAYEAPGGTPGGLTITVWDLLGNQAVEDFDEIEITLDANKPTISKLFPTNADAPKNVDNDDEPTINLTTKNPAFQYDEDLDSIAVRYSEVGGGKRIQTSGWGPGNINLEKPNELVTFDIDDTTFVERQRYELEVLAIDLAGNASVNKSGTLTFTKGFGNPHSDKFEIVASPEEKQVAGIAITLTVSVLDTMLSRIEETDVRAVTYPRGDEVVSSRSVIAVIVPGNQADALDGVTFGPEDKGVSAAPPAAFELPGDLAGMEYTAAILDRDGWHAGQRIVEVKSTKPLTGAIIMAAEGALDPATGRNAVRISGKAETVINVEVAEFAKFVVSTMENENASSTVSGPFTVNVVPTDEFGNESMKEENTVGSDAYESVAVTINSNNSAVVPPPGQQMVVAGGSDFGAVASNISGSATITVRTVLEDYTTGDDTGALSGSVDVNFIPDGGVVDPGAPAAVASISAEDWAGPTGEGDHGGFVMISFPNSADHEEVVGYRIDREINATTGLDDEGELVDLDEPVKTWMTWANLSANPDSGRAVDANGDMQRIVVPTFDSGDATNWGVVSVGSTGPSDRTAATAASKRVFTKESVQQALELLGIEPEAFLIDDELMDQMNASEDYVKSIIGDQEVTYVPANPDLSVLTGGAAVPGNIRTALTVGDLLQSARTVTEEPVGAVDNIPPAAVTDASGDGLGGVVLNWTGSLDDGVVVYSQLYLGHRLNILGVKGYTVLRGASAEELEEIATLPAGSVQFVDENLPDGATSLVYRIDVFDDGEKPTEGQVFTVDNIAIRQKFVDAEGEPVYLMKLPSQGGDLTVNFEDFIVFAAAFNSQRGGENYNLQADVDDDGTVDFADFMIAAPSFNRTAVIPAGSKLAIVPQRPGVNDDTEMTLQLTGDKVLVGESISVTVSMANAEQLTGFGLELTYDADKFEFVSAVPAENDLLKSSGGETPLFKTWTEDGRIAVVNALVDENSVSGKGQLVTFTFKVLREFTENARFEIASGVVFDPEQLSNPVVSLGALDIQSTPTEFALHQNYPNPFNPQTNIPYDLAEAGDVVLRIYNLLGQEVRTLVRERQAAGRYNVQWSGVDDRGVSVSSGIYFYQVSVAGKFQDAKRLMLLK